MRKLALKVSKTSRVAASGSTPAPSPLKATALESAIDGKKEEIRFYRANERPYGVFSNLFPRPMEFEGVVYPTSEHAYQAGKASKPEVREWILNAPSPSLAAMAAHGLYVWDVKPNWAQTKFDRMRAVLRAKFDQHPDLKEVLLSTGEFRLVEAGTVNNAVNRLWGEVEGKGQNMLGVMLMELRSEYNTPQNPALSKRRSDNTSPEQNAFKAVYESSHD